MLNPLYALLFRPGAVNLVDFPAYVDKLHENSNLLFADGFRVGINCTLAMKYIHQLLATFNQILASLAQFLIR